MGAFPVLGVQEGNPQKQRTFSNLKARVQFVQPRNPLAQRRRGHPGAWWGRHRGSILFWGLEFGKPDLTYLAPQAIGNTWYPYSFLAPLEQNEPFFSAALFALQSTLQTVEDAGVAQARTVLLGFSQGACLALEFAARHGNQFGGLVGLSGGLIGPPDTPREYGTQLENTPVFLGCSDVDAHIPLARVHETTEVLTRLGAEVTERIYPGMGHTINADEIAHISALLEQLHAPT